MADNSAIPNPLIAEVLKRQKALSPFMRGLLGVTDAPPVPGWDPSMSGLSNTVSSLVPQSMRPPAAVDANVDYQDPRAVAYSNMPQGGQIDPAQAGAQGFRVPGYIPPAQTAGGSGDYMSKVMTQSSSGGIGSDYVAGGPPSPDVVAAGATPSQDDSMFSFFGKPEATDALTAFGAGMLRGKNFSEGLANATEGVNNVAKQYRGLTPREIALLEQKASLQRRLNPQLQKGDIWYSPDGNAYREVFNPNSPNGSSFLDITSGKQIQSLPPGSTQRVDSSIGERNTANAKFETEARDLANKSFTDIQTYDNMLGLLPTSGAGPDAISNAKRAFVQTTGIDLNGVNLKDMQTVNKLSRDLELSLAQTQRGLGQFTEMERKIVREALPSLDTDPAAFRRMVEMLRNRAEKSQRLYEDWISMPRDVKNSQYGGSFENFAYFWKKQNSGQASTQQSQGSASGVKPSLDQIFGN